MMRSIWIGGLIAPLAAPIAFNVFVFALSVAKDGWVIGTHDWPAGIAAALVFVLPVSYLVTWLLGMPYIYWLQRNFRLSIPTVCTGAACCGAIGTWLIQKLGKNSTLNVETFALGTLFGAILAVCVALTFCWLARVPMSAETK